MSIFSFAANAAPTLNGDYTNTPAGYDPDGFGSEVSDAFNEDPDTNLCESPVNAAITRRAIYKNGYRPVPVFNVYEFGKGKVPFGKGWQETARCLSAPGIGPIDPKATNTGILCDDLRCIDVDVDDPISADLILEGAEIIFGAGALVRCRANSPRKMLVYRAATPSPKRRVHNKVTNQAVEVLGHGQQFVAFGWHHSGTQLLWKAGRSPARIPFDELPTITEDQISILLELASNVLGIEASAELLQTDSTSSHRHGESALTMEDVRALLGVMPADDGYDDWLTVGAAIFAVDNGPDGLAAWDTWSQRSPKHSRPDLVRKWGAMRGNPLSSITAGTLIHRARLADPTFITPSLRARIAADLGSKASSTTATTPPQGHKARFKMMSIGDVLDMPPPSWLIPDLLLEQSVASIYGPPASFKSFLALDIAMSLASGSTWNGKQIIPGGVAYVAAEGAAGLRNRVSAWMSDRGVAAPESFTVIPEIVPLSDRQAVDDLIAGLQHRAEATAFPIKLVVLDTLARCSVGVDENSSKEMGVVIDAVIRIRTALNCTVLIVHHTGKDSKRGMRGSNRLVGDLDTTIEIERGDASVTMRVQKQKDAEDGDPIRFEMRKVEISTQANSLVPVLINEVVANTRLIDAMAIAHKVPVGEIKTLSAVIGCLDWKRSKASYARIKSCVPVDGISVLTKDGKRKISRIADGKLHGSLIVEAV